MSCCHCTQTCPQAPSVSSFCIIAVSTQQDDLHPAPPGGLRPTQFFAAGTKMLLLHPSPLLPSSTSPFIEEGPGFYLHGAHQLLWEQGFMCFLFGLHLRHTLFVTLLHHEAFEYWRKQFWELLLFWWTTFINDPYAGNIFQRPAECVGYWM